MKKNKFFRKGIVGILVTCMVSTMLLPAMSVYASDDRSYIFDLGSNIGSDNIIGSSNSVWQAIRGNTTKYVLSGTPAGSILAKLQYSSLPQQGDIGGANARPELPVPTIRHESGYIFDGWYTGANGTGSRITRLPSSFFPYENITYHAKYAVNQSVKFGFRVEHKSIEGVVFNYRSFERNAETMIGTIPSSSIAGYKFKEYRVSIGGTYIDDLESEGFSISTDDNRIQGTMPNKPVTIKCIYEVDTSQEFSVTMRYQYNGVDFGVPSIVQFNAGAELDVDRIKPTLEGDAFEGYVYRSGTTPMVIQQDQDIRHETSLGILETLLAFNEDGTLDGSFKMPNQDIEIIYDCMLDPSINANIHVTYVDNLGTNLNSSGNFVEIEQCIYVVPQGGDVDILIPDLSDYGYPYQNVRSDWESSNSWVLQENIVDGQIRIQGTAGIGNNDIRITYMADLNDDTNWKRVMYDVSNINGTINGNTASRFFNPGEYTIEELTDGINIIPSDGFQFDGWHKVIGVESSPLESPFNLQEEITLRPILSKDPAYWKNIDFIAGSNGYLSGGISSLSVYIDTLWSDVEEDIPLPMPINGFRFDEWHRINGIGINPSNHSFTEDMTYIAVFADLDDTSLDLNMPIADAFVDGASGAGEIRVVSVVDNRSYVVVNKESGNVVSSITGSQINNGGDRFTPIALGDIYIVYEVTAGVTVPAIGNSFEDNVIDTNRSAGLELIMPAIGSNFETSEDTGNAGKAKLTINPAASNTEYALIDSSNIVVGGWTLSSGNLVTFDNLMDNEVYRVVAKASGTTGTPMDKIHAAVSVNVNIDVSDNNAAQYSLSIIGDVNGAFISRVGSTMYTNGTTELTVSGGATVTITAPLSNGGRSFREWRCVLSNQIYTSRTQNFPMPAGNMVLVPIYRDDPNRVNVEGVSSNNGLGIEPNDGLGAALTTSEDEARLGENRQVLYKIRLNKRNANAAEITSTRAESLFDNESAFNAAWAVDVNLTRFVDGSQRPIPDDNTGATITVWAQLEDAYMGNLNYELWEIDRVTGEATPVTMNPSPNDEDVVDGVFAFQANTRSTYVLTYSKAFNVRLINKVTGNNENVNVIRGEAIDSESKFTDWLQTILAELSIDRGSITLTYEGIGLQENGAEFDTSNPITRNLTLYAMYSSAENSYWREAWDKLNALIELVREIEASNNISDYGRDELRIPIINATSVLNDEAADLGDLNDAHNTLESLAIGILRGEVVDSIAEAEGRLTANDNLTEESENDLRDKITSAETVLSNNNSTFEDLRDAFIAIWEGIDSITTVDGGSGDGGSGDSDGSGDSGGSGGSGGSSGSGGSGSSGGSGGSGSSGGGAGGSSGGGTNTRRYNVGSNGGWVLAEGTSNNWIYALNASTHISNSWALLPHTHGNETSYYWYYFMPNGIMRTGWFRDTDNKWYFLNNKNNGWFGSMITGWVQSEGLWYYFDPTTGEMATGWREIDGKWYFFSTSGIDASWRFKEDEDLFGWNFHIANTYPLGAMFSNTTTPDGYSVNESGVHVR